VQWSPRSPSCWDVGHVAQEHERLEVVADRGGGGGDLAESAVVSGSGCGARLA
jgi:hypothetical protein